MSSDSRHLARLTLKDHNGRVHRLHPELCRPKGRFCDESGTISPHAVRVVYMMAGILPPQSDSAEDLFASVQQNIMLLNAYMQHSGASMSSGPTGLAGRRTKKVVLLESDDAVIAAPPPAATPTASKAARTAKASAKASASPSSGKSSKASLQKED